MVNGNPKVLQKFVLKKPAIKRITPKPQPPEDFIEPIEAPVEEFAVESKEMADKETQAEQTAQMPENNQEILEKLAEQSRQIAELKELLEKKEMPKIEKTQLNKIQLFNGIKRYLNPTMVSFLRMEMFGGNDRQYKPDEKDLCTELFSLGVDVYKHFSDEFRFRLPPVREVESWNADKGNEIFLENDF